MNVVVWGARGSLPSPDAAMRRYGGSTSCVTVDITGEPLLIIDAGTGIARIPAAAVVGRGANLVLSHLHWDHVIGLPFFACTREGTGRVDVYGPPGETGFHKALDAVISPPGFPIDTSGFQGGWGFHDLGDEPLTLGPIRVTARAIRHRGATLGFRVDYEGSAIAYLSDHGPGAEDRGPAEDDVVPESVLDLVDGVNLLFHDAQYTDAEYQQLRSFGHATPGYAVRVAAAGGVGTLLLFHHDPARTDEGVDKMVAVARHAATELGFRGHLRAAAENDHFAIGSTDRSRTNRGVAVKLMVIAAIGRGSSTTNILGCQVVKICEDHGMVVDFVTPTELALPVNDGNVPYDLPAAKAWQARVEACDAFIWISPEYHSAMTGGIKNLFDYLGKEALRGDVVGLCALAGGAMAALNTLNNMSMVARSLGAWVAPDYCAYNSNEVKEGLDEASVKRLEAMCLSVIDACRRLRAPLPPDIQAFDLSG